MQPQSATETGEFLPSPRQGSRPPGSPSTAVDVAGRTHPGKVRPNNEDNFLVVRFGRYLQTLTTSLPDGQVPRDYGEAGHGMVVADGMGGLAAGEVASRLAIALLVQLVIDTPDWIMGLDSPHVEEVIDRAARRFREVNERLIEQARSRPGLRGMGTTLTMACSLGRDLLVAHVGDSPVYLGRAGELYKLTRDHTLAQEMADLGSAPGADIPARFRHVLTHAIGVPETGSEPETRRYGLADDDRLLLCTDGLTDMVDDAAIAEILRRDQSAEAACQALIDRALEGGGRDNITAVVARYRMTPAH